MTKGACITWGTMVLVLCASLSVSADAPTDITEAAGEKRITLNVDSAPITAALRMVAEQGGLNISIGPGVDGVVSVYLTDAPLAAALKSIALDNGFACSVEGGIISVTRKQETQGAPAPQPVLKQAVFTLRYQDAARVMDTLQIALSPFGKMKVLNENSPSEFQSQKLGDLSGDLETDGESAIRGSGNDRVDLNSGPPQNARKLLVVDVEENIAHLAELIADLDQIPPQVLIEARIVEMTTDLQKNLGIDWNVNILANGPILTHELPLDWRAGYSGGNLNRYTGNGTASSSVGLALGTIDMSQFTALLRIHENDNAMRLLANPRLLVFNNHSASILVGERYPILATTITDQGTVTESFDTYIPVGVQLEVHPNIMPDGRVSMLVHPVTSALGDEVVGSTGLRVRRINTRELNTRVIMEDGQTIVLGGLISDRKIRQINKIPGLGDLPLLDIFFRQENPRSERVDLLIFLTIHVEAGAAISERDREVFEMYKPHFKQVQRLQDVQLHFEIPSEYEPPKPMYGDPPADDDDAESWEGDSGGNDHGAISHRSRNAPGSGQGNRMNPGRTLKGRSAGGIQSKDSVGPRFRPVPRHEITATEVVSENARSPGTRQVSRQELSDEAH